jgi:signal transduction histidine kinase
MTGTNRFQARGLLRWFQRGAPLPDPGDSPEQRQLKAQVEALRISHAAAQEQMQRLDEVKSDFITIASHELRTPLAQIRGCADVLDALYEADALDSDELGNMIVNIRKASERMEELIAAMLDVSQLDVNAMNLHFTPTTLESAMRLAIEPLTEAMRQRKIALSARGLKGLPGIHADMQRLVQALRNVLVNAVKYTPDGGRIDITAELRGGESDLSARKVHVTIADTGVGIQPEHLELIFHKFFRGHDPSLHSTGAYKFMGAGPGLGLTIAKGVIEGHGGEIWAESTGYDAAAFPGSTFHILLPVQPTARQNRIDLKRQPAG